MDVLTSFPQTTKQAMMLDHALHLAKLGFHVFPVLPGKKAPPFISHFPTMATRSEDQLRVWWGIRSDFNIGISTTRFGESEALIVVDIDDKGGKHGSKTIEQHEREGKTYPKTWTQTTSSGGTHYIYRTKTAVSQSVQKLGEGIDIRSQGGYVLGAGSCIQGLPKPYTLELNGVGCNGTTPHGPAQASEWLVEACGEKKVRTARDASANVADLAKVAKINQTFAENHAVHFLRFEAKPSLQGDGGDLTAFMIAARVKDFGVPKDVTLALMLDHWNVRCEPPWSLDELRVKVENAYAYGTEVVGVAAPEMQFEKVEAEIVPPVKHPFDVMNEEYAYLSSNGASYVLHETKNEKGKRVVRHVSIVDFHNDTADRPPLPVDGGKSRILSRAWIQSPRKRRYNGLCFMPEQKPQNNYYNLWHGFAYEPLAAGVEPSETAQKALNAWLEHVEANACDGDVTLTHWLSSYFAHMIQKPWEKPGVALVFKGEKGTGKNVLVETVGELLGPHFALVSDKHMVLGNFNSYLENKVMLVLDEAFWSGDKQAEGKLKHLITGTEHNIERKGKEPYSVANCLRTVILGNEPWVAPASHDERRYAVFNMGTKRQTDRKFFYDTIILGMRQGGYELLLRYLQSFDISQADVFAAPNTVGLQEQKEESLRPFDRWWKECLSDGKFVSGGMGGDWSQEVSRDELRDVFKYYLAANNISGRKPTANAFARQLKAVLPKIEGMRKWTGSHREHFYLMPPLPEARKAWEKYIGHKCEWEQVFTKEEEELFS